MPFLETETSLNSWPPRGRKWLRQKDLQAPSVLWYFLPTRVEVPGDIVRSNHWPGTFARAAQSWIFKLDQPYKAVSRFNRAKSGVIAFIFIHFCSSTDIRWASIVSRECRRERKPQILQISALDEVSGRALNDLYQITRLSQWDSATFIIAILLTWDSSSLSCSAVTYCPILILLSNVAG